MKAGNVTPGAFTLGAILGSEPTDITKIADFSAGLEEHEHPFVDGMYENDAFARRRC